ncbi:gamma-glutamylcyclotransferase [Luteolibacter flavescens]|uniref:Gamma-glutamylcyclotransferase n=1 Tax=Luteolibacter flavescens TaxID=1859460 RepID=A0ABT3FSP4_9BACT|nr:gamma-glutamylcyclotransferase [Luteolibacter flavescens]MCW1886219.1 gamma-glutamylcyclotransferase [Luteolibacter flavescens]
MSRGEPTPERMRALEDEFEMVFVYSSLRRQCVDAYRMAGTQWMGEGEIAGGLFTVDASPAWQRGHSGMWVKGDLFQISPDHLLDLDSRGEAIERAIDVSGKYRRVRVKVYGIAPSRYLGDAWAWEWTGSTERGHAIESGDWIDADQPPPPSSWYTHTAGLLLLGFFAAFVVLLSDLHPFHGTPLLKVILGLLTMVPMIAGIMAYWGIRRREIAKNSARWILAASFVLSIPMTWVLVTEISAWIAF